MKGHSLLIAAIILAALSGVLYWSEHRKPADTAVKVSADAPPKILSLNTADITKLDIKKKSGDEVALAKNDAGKWQMIAPNKDWHADQNEITSMLSTFSSLTSERLIEDKASSVEPYGLANPSLEIDLTEKDNKTQKLLIGDTTPTGDGVYVALAGDPRVFTLANYTKNNLDKSAKDLRDKRLLTFDSDKLSRVELAAKKQDIEFGRNKDQWQIVKPKPLRADDSQVQDLIRKLGDARMDLTASDDDQKKAVAAFASGTAVASAKLTDASGTQELQVRKNKTDYYAKSSAVEGIYKVTLDLGTSLDKGVEDFRNKKLFDLGFSEPDKIELHDGAKSWFLTRGGEDWWLQDGKKADPIGAQGFVEQVRDLAASTFVDSGFSAATIELTVTSNSGKTIEKVLIAKNGDHYIAKRDGEPALYQFDPVVVTSLEKAAEDIKPAPEPKPADKPKK
ncbi:MAG TPA: DUF4340 domain-containing protein [Candidatus Acidoferrum sp.]|nr:DUF4340 domain-containing protein [Candidatus Acidoferrum sp.]